MSFDLIEKDIVKWRRDLHKIPELGNELPKTVKYVETVLDEMGISYHKLVNGNAIVALIQGNSEGKCIGLRGDMDGLPIKEETGLEFSSTTGNMHACGHDGHTAMLLGAATYLNSHRDEFKGAVKLLFQPGEEAPGGAKPMIDEGALQNPKVDAVFGLHSGQLSQELVPGQVGFRHGSMMAAPDRFVININGKGSHGAYPEQSKDPIVIASELILALQTLVSREKKATDPAVLSVCRIEGGFNHNIIPNKVELEGTVRTTSPDLRNYFKKRIEDYCAAFSMMHGINIEADYQFFYPPLINDVDFTDLAIAEAEKLLGKERVLVLENPIMGGEDMAYFLEEAPGTFMFLSNPYPVDDVCYPHHHPKFDTDEQYLKDGAMLLAKVAIKYLNS